MSDRLHRVVAQRGERYCRFILEDHSVEGVGIDIFSPCCYLTSFWKKNVRGGNLCSVREGINTALVNTV